MPKINFHIKIFKAILLLGFVLFSLSPCTVKEVILSSVNAESANSLNKTKTTASISSCAYSHNENQLVSVEKNSKSNKQTEPVDIFDKPFSAVHSTKVCNKYSKTSLGHSPPKYILYKRLKIDIA